MGGFRKTIRSEDGGGVIGWEVGLPHAEAMTVSQVLFSKSSCGMSEQAAPITTVATLVMLSLCIDLSDVIMWWSLKPQVTAQNKHKAKAS